MSRAMRIAMAIVSAPLACTLLLAGCLPSGPAYKSSNAAYDRSTITGLLDAADISRVERHQTSESSRLRHAALAALRQSGTDASGVADLLTQVLPSDTRGVPVYVERATYEGKRAVIVVEATGPPGGHLNSKRLWVLDEQGDVLFAGSK